MNEEETQNRMTEEESAPHPGPRYMGLKFLALQLFMIAFGVALFFALAALKEPGHKAESANRRAAEPVSAP